MAVEGQFSGFPSSPEKSTLSESTFDQSVCIYDAECDKHAPLSLQDYGQNSKIAVSHRRRTSLPSEFRYGSRSLESCQYKPSVIIDTDAHRRPRSFDSAVARLDSCTKTQSYWKRLLRRYKYKEREVSRTSSDAFSSILVLESRILKEQNQVLQYASRIWSGSTTNYWFQPIKVLLSSRRKESSRVKKLSLVLEAAQRQRSLNLLNDLKISLLQEEDEEDDEGASRSSQQEHANKLSHVEPNVSHCSECSLSVQSEETLVHRHSNASIPLPYNNSRLDIQDTELMFTYDTLIQVLKKQSEWLRHLIQLRKDKVTSIAMYSANRYKQPLAKGTEAHTGSRQLQQFLDTFQPYSGIFSIPIARDLPTTELVQFEKLLTKYRFIKPVMKDALELLYDETLRSFLTQSKYIKMSHTKCKVFDERDPREIMAFLIHEVVENIMETSQLDTASYRVYIYLFVEQMVFSRLACTCYRPVAFDLDDLNALWRTQKCKVRILSFKQIGLAKDEFAQEATYFQESLFVINQLPYLAPTCILASYIKCIQVIHKEAGLLLQVSKESISADILLPALVYILSRSRLLHIHSQVYLMEHFSMETLRAWKDEEKGGEIAYYLACLQAAVGYIMNYEAGTGS